MHPLPKHHFSDGPVFVGKMTQVSNQLLQRGATEILNKPGFESGS